jgi:hypothetical protein
VQLRPLLRYIWAAPASAVGLLLASPALLVGAANIACNSGALEVTLRTRRLRAPHGPRWLPFAAITFGHVVIAVGSEEQRLLRAHERVHVAQYERLGPLFLLAYPAESLLQLMRGRRPYLDNRFELEARRLSEPSISSTSEA